MNKLPEEYLSVSGAKKLPDELIEVEFSTGERGIVNVREFMSGPLFQELINTGGLMSFIFDEDSGTIIWPNGLDVAPERLYSEATLLTN